MLRERETGDEDRDARLGDERKPELTGGEAALYGLDDAGSEIERGSGDREQTDRGRRAG
jgi:hypothetical protein